MDKMQLRAIFCSSSNWDVKQQNSEIKTAFGPETTWVRTVERWFSRFRNGDEKLKDEQRSGRPSEIDDDQLKKLVEASPRATLRGLASGLGVSGKSVCIHLQKIGKGKKLDK
ncbi:unnamed protein product [Heligmosomoides polygyrus]|uniref:HTH_48 domain-containing protein n=1 Tax=Heligmosomoides polygyrus TaxID=6339 RepID=A0A183FMX5_HELPZ|nr:unnamed protein product [Heligmosomoides polygyrus]